MGEPFKPHRESGAALRTLLELLASGSGQAKRQTTAVLGIVGAFDQARANERLDGAADCGSAATYAIGHRVEGRRLGGADRFEELAAPALGAFRRAVSDPVLRNGDEAAGKRLRR